MCCLLAIVLIVLFFSDSQATELRIGLIPEQNVFDQVARYRPLEDYIKKKIGMNIKFTMLSRYGNIIEHFTNRGLDGAFWGSFTGAMAITKLGIEPVARPVSRDGSSTYHGYIFVRKDSNIRNVADMRGKIIAFVERATTAGYIFPIAYFRENGARDINTYFKEYYFTGSHDVAIRAVLSGQADVGTTINTIFNQLARADRRIEKELMILAKSPRVPANALGIRKTLDPEVERRLRDALLGIDREPDGKKILQRFGAIRFIPTVKEDYKPVFDIARRAGIDVENYVYINE
ncbi:MAG: phosphate/phosphite/phosphonate ABC transporter substrate-binding protein [Deltaproteobacteria bacterium]|nr:phosphate/phosphite/phosphonate ABC transporter substrate-binding protein [Deltaproteobacteria bacterium]